MDSTTFGRRALNSASWRILPIPSDSKAELVFADDHGRRAAALHFGQVHTADTRRADGFGNINNGILIPLNNIDLFVVQFFDNSLDSHAFDPHACTNRIYACLRRHHCNLGTRAGLPGNGADFHHAMINLRDFVF
jgi:hypothetical protein